MSQKDLSRLLTGVFMSMGICGLVVFGYFVPELLKTFLKDVDCGAYAAWLTLSFVSAVPCYLVLFCGLRVAKEIGRDNSFSVINSRLLKETAIFAAVDCVIVFAGSSIFYLLGFSSVNLEILSLLIVFTGIVIIVVASVLSHLVYKAALMREENDLTI